jgi:hypothetical protein
MEKITPQYSPILGRGIFPRVKGDFGGREKLPNGTFPLRRISQIQIRPDFSPPLCSRIQFAKYFRTQFWHDLSLAMQR